MLFRADDVEQTLTGLADVGDHQRFGAFAVAGQQGFDDRPVLLLGLVNWIPCAELLGRAEAGLPVERLRGRDHLDEQRVVRGIVDERVHPTGQVQDLGDISRPGTGFAAQSGVMKRPMLDESYLAPKLSSPDSASRSLPVNLYAKHAKRGVQS